MRPQVQLLDPHVVVDLARRGAREGLEVDLRRRRHGGVVIMRTLYRTAVTTPCLYRTAS